MTSMKGSHVEQREYHRDSLGPSIPDQIIQ